MPSFTDREYIYILDSKGRNINPFVFALIRDNVLTLWSLASFSLGSAVAYFARYTNCHLTVTDKSLE